MTLDNLTAAERAEALASSFHAVREALDRLRPVIRETAAYLTRLARQWDVSGPLGYRSPLYALIRWTLPHRYRRRMARQRARLVSRHHR